MIRFITDNRNVQVMFRDLCLGTDNVQPLGSGQGKIAVGP